MKIPNYNPKTELLEVLTKQGDLVLYTSNEEVMDEYWVYYIEPETELDAENIASYLVIDIGDLD